MGDTQERPVSSLDRVVFFSDAVMAIAITLLVVEIGVPDVAADELGAALADKWPEYFSFVLSFVVIGAYWFVHHSMFRIVVRLDRRFMVLNLYFLLCIAFLPFPTAVLGEEGQSEAAVIAYAATITATGLASAAMWWYATWNGRLTIAGIAEETLRDYRRRSLVSPAVFAVSIPIALVSPEAAQYTWIAAGVLPPALKLLTGRASR